jgi:hypothetical protein
MNNNITNQTNLLNDINFIDTIKFEAEYAQKVKGGHLPYYIGAEKATRLVSQINILSQNEKLQLVKSVFVSRN